MLFFIDGLQVGGAERSLLALCQHLLGFQPIVLALSDSLALKPEFEKSGIQVIVHPIPRNYRFKRNARKIKPLVDSISPVLIHSSLFHADMILRYLDTTAVKVTGLVSSMYSKGRLKQLPWLTQQKIGVLKYWDSQTSQSIDHFIANSNSIRNLYLQEVGYDFEKVQVIFRGRKLQPVSSKNSRGTNQFLFVGRLIQSKGLAAAIKAFGILLHTHPDLVFKIAGEGPEKESLQELIEKLSLKGRVNLLGQVDQVSELLRESSYFIFPTHYEGLPGALIEAMLARVPIICSDIPENRECVDESMALFHRVGDQADLLAQMEKALTLTDWEERTKRAYDFAAEHFDIENIVKQYEQVYRVLLNL